MTQFIKVKDVDVSLLKEMIQKRKDKNVSFLVFGDGKKRFADETIEFLEKEFSGDMNISQVSQFLVFKWKVGKRI